MVDTLDSVVMIRADSLSLVPELLPGDVVVVGDNNRYVLEPILRVVETAKVEFPVGKYWIFLGINGDTTNTDRGLRLPAGRCCGAIVSMD